MAASSRVSARRGISLLEVLISIGIISIGLLATFSLIPAGRSYMYKAAIDDRAAAMIPAAFETIATQNLFKVSEVSWVNVGSSDMDPELRNYGVVIRNQYNVDVTTTRSGTLDPAMWNALSIDTETISQWHTATSPDPFTISGQIDPATAPSANIALTVSPAIGGATNLGSVPTNGAGKWSKTLDSSTPPTAPKMVINGTGSDPGGVKNTPWTDYTFTATYFDGMGTLRQATPSPATYRQYGDRRSLDVRTGTALTTFMKPDNATTFNDYPGQATALGLATLDNASATGRNVAARSVSKTMTGSLWRMRLGSIHRQYTQNVTFADVPDAPPNPQTLDVGTWDITDEPGTYVSGSSILADDADWYTLPVRAGEIITLQAGTVDNLKKDPTDTYYFPLYFGQPADMALMSPIASLSVAGSRYTYFVTTDGSVFTRALLNDTAMNTFYPAGKPRAERSNSGYSFTISRMPSERVVVIDPLAATRLDKSILGTGGGQAVLRRQRFADYNQVYADATGTRQQRIIPRLNWQKLTGTSLNIDVALATSELLFRDTDTLQVDTTVTATNADAAPAPLFDMGAGNTAVRRQVAGKMSWLIMAQPEAAGPAATNWTAGSWFDVSVVVFEDRPLPEISGPPFTGEYAQQNVSQQSPLAGVWSDLEGTLSVAIPGSPATDITEDDEARRLFRTGAWILLAPAVIDPLTNPAEDRQKVEWVRVQSARMESSGGVRTMKILLEKEPSDWTLNRSLQAVVPRPHPLLAPVNAGEYNVVVLAYSGVVAVVSRTLQLE